jgi:hypothetical protein
MPAAQWDGDDQRRRGVCPRIELEVDGVLRFAYDIDLTAFIGRKAHDEES